MKEEIINLKNQAIAQITDAESSEELEEIRIDLIGRTGKLTNLIKEIRKLEGDERREVGFIINETKNTIEEFLGSQRSKIKNKTRDWFDETIPGEKPTQGHIHLVTKGINEIVDVFEKIGFERLRYMEVDWDWYAFESLNFAENHPARDDWETFFVDAPESRKYGPMLLTPHTS